MTNEEAIKTVSELTSTIVTIGVGYLMNEDQTMLTHSFILLRAGDIEAMSEPKLLDVPLIPLDAMRPPDKDLN